MDHLRSPVELYTAEPDGSGVRAITAVNGGRLSRIKLGELMKESKEEEKKKENGGENEDEEDAPYLREALNVLADLVRGG